MLKVKGLVSLFCFLWGPTSCPPSRNWIPSEELKAAFSKEQNWPPSLCKDVAKEISSTEVLHCRGCTSDLSGRIMSAHVKAPLLEYRYSGLEIFAFMSLFIFLNSMPFAWVQMVHIHLAYHQSRPDMFFSISSWTDTSSTRVLLVLAILEKCLLKMKKRGMLGWNQLA